jgi:1-acyl-sn-glycerol-3-phosphate acyltransferase
LFTSVRAALATVTGNLYLLFGSLFWGTTATLLGWIPPRGNLMFFSARNWGRGLLWASGVRVERSFAAPLDPLGRYIFMANHQSMFDIPLLLATLPGQTRFLAKRSLFKIPVFGWGLAAGGFIPVDRQDRSRARDTFAVAIERIEAGNSILLFPEETRSADGALLPFQRGGFLLAMRSGLPIVPVGISGTRQVQPKGNWAIRPGRVRVRYGRPIATADLELRRKRELVTQVRDAVAELAEVSAGPGGADTPAVG